MSSSQRKPSFAAMAASAAAKNKKETAASASSTPPPSNEKTETPAAPPTPPLSDPVASGNASPSATIAIPTAEDWKAVGSPPRKMSIPTINELDTEDARQRRARAQTTPENNQDKWNSGSLSMGWNVGGNSNANKSIWNNNSTDALDEQKRRVSLRPEILMPQSNFSLEETEEFEQLKGDDDDERDAYSVPKARNRSKSSSAVFGLSNDDETPEMWSAPREASPRLDQTREMLHRRASTQPSGFNGLWESLKDHEEEVQMPYRLSERRFSHAPNLNPEFNNSQLMPPTTSEIPEDFPQDIGRRRHSLAGPLYAPGNSNSRYLSEALGNLNLEETPNFTDINDYFENTENRTRAWVEAGKNLQAQSFSQHWPLYVVEFKAGRHDFFFVDDPSLTVKKGDLAIVEADRGKDLGKVIHDNIQNMQQLQLYQANHVDLLAENSLGKDVHPKRIYRLAAPAEVALLVSKSQDEAKAMSICQSKIRQKKLPMEVVDAEYQWDRRKLTLYFVADRRIDFRELVRDLFKIYKTRIWMCAVNPLKIMQNNK